MSFPFRLFKTKEKNRPLFVVFHGAGALGNDNIKQHFENIFAPHGQNAAALTAKDVITLYKKTTVPLRVLKNSANELAAPNAADRINLKGFVLFPQNADAPFNIR